MLAEGGLMDLVSIFYLVGCWLGEVGLHVCWAGNIYVEERWDGLEVLGNIDWFVLFLLV